MRLVNLIDFRVLVLLSILIVSGCATQPPVKDSRQQSAVRMRAKAHTDLGAAYFQQKRYGIALEEFSLAANIDPNFGFAFNGLGLVSAALSQDEEADRYFRRAIEIAPKNSEARNNYGNFLCSRGRYDESIKEFLAAVKNPLYATPDAAYTNAGICAMRGKQLDKASDFFQKALQKNPLSYRAAYELSLLQFKQNNAVAAYDTLAPQLQSNPTAKVLYLGAQLAQALNKPSDARLHQMTLFKNYPNSKEALALKKAMQQGQ